MEAADEDQERILQEALGVVKRQSFYMKRSIDQNDFEKSLRDACLLLHELRTGKLSPKNYYELYMAVTDELRHLQLYFADLNKRGKHMVDMYQRVQYAGNVVARLYLLVTVGGVYIESHEAPAREVLKDLVEMSKGVQHPIRGLFIRNYLSQITKDKLPDVNSGYLDDDDVESSYQDAIDFILQNFGEMNRLWVRIQHQGRAKTRMKREKERQQLKLLVGTNLVRLSQLECVTLPMYQEKVLPKVLEIITNCNDKIAQQYLMDCVIQVFPDEYHLHTLGMFLATCGKLHAEVDVGLVIKSLMDRIAGYAADNGGSHVIPEDIDAFEVISTHIAQVIEERQASMDMVDVLSLQVGLLDFANKCYANNLDYINKILAFCVKVADEGNEQLTGDAAKHVVKLLITPLEVVSIQVLGISYYPTLMKFLDWEARKNVAARLLQAVLDTQTVLEDAPTLDQLLKFISPLIVDDEDTPAKDQLDKFEFEEHQNMVAKLVHRLHPSGPDDMAVILNTMRKYFSRGGEDRIKFTMVPLCFKYFQLARSIYEYENPPIVVSGEGGVQEASSADDKPSSQEQTGDKQGEDAAGSGEDVAEEADKVTEEAGDATEEADKVTEEADDATEEAAEAATEEAGEVTEQVVQETIKEDKSKATATNDASDVQNDTPKATTVQPQALPKLVVSSRQVFQQVHEIITAIASVSGLQDVALKMFLQAASAANNAMEESIAYEFMVQAFTLYEDTADSKTQIRMITLMIGTLQRMVVFGKENFDTLVTKMAQYAARLLKKPDQCRMVYTCAHLFWSAEPVRPLREDEVAPAAGADAKRALECLKKSLKIADACVAASHVSLFVEILNQYVYFFDSGMDTVQPKYIVGLVELINEHVGQLSGDSEENNALKAYYACTMQHIRSKASGDQATRYKDISL